MLNSFHTTPGEVNAILEDIDQHPTTPVFLIVEINYNTFKNIRQSGTANVIGSSKFKNTVTTNEGEVALKLMLDLQDQLTRLRIQNKQLQNEVRSLRERLSLDMKPADK